MVSGDRSPDDALLYWLSGDRSPDYVPVGSVSSRERHRTLHIAAEERLRAPLAGKKSI